MENRNDDSFTGIFNVWQIISALVPAILSAGVAVYGYHVGQEGVKSLWVIGIGVVSTIVVFWCSFSIVIKLTSAIKDARRKEEQAGEALARENELAEMRLKVEKAMAFDYKMYAPLDSESVSRIFQHYGWSIDPLSDREVRLVGAQEDKYIGLAQLLASDSPYGGDFRCLPVRNDDKWEKCIIQVSFIPIDRNGKIPIILRMPLAHSRDAELHSRKAKFTFVSFSPVPIRYEKPFDMTTCYQREVPNRVEDSEFSFDEIGCTMKYESKEGKRRIYLFYVVAVHYPAIGFTDENGSLDMAVMKRLFAVDPDAPPEKLKFFCKDHDVIVAAASPREIYNAFSADGNWAAVPEHLARLLSKTDYVVRSEQRDSDTNEEKIFEDHFDFSERKLGEVELAHIQQMRQK